MNKIDAISISGIRGIKNPLDLNLKSKSILIYGDNGCGKSSITDAFEWFYSDRVGHLISEETGSTKGKGALRNLFLDDDEDAFIKIEYTNPNLNSRKSINGALKVIPSNTSDEFKNLIADSESENLILRYKDLIKFIIATKKDKLDTLQNIIGFGQVGEIRDLLKRNAGRIGRNLKSAQYDNKKGVQQSIIIEHFGQNITSAQHFFDVANEIIKPLNLKVEIQNYQNIKEVLSEIASKEDTELIEKIGFYSKVNEILSEIVGIIDSLNIEYNSYCTSVSSLIKEKDKIEKLQLLSLLVEGQSLLEKEIIKEDYCPLCQQSKSKAELLIEINSRIEELQLLKEEKEKIEQQSSVLQQKINSNITLVNSLLREKNIKKEENKVLEQQINEISSRLNNYNVELKKNLLLEPNLLDVKDITLNKIEIKETAVSSNNLSKSLSESHKKNSKLQIHTKLSLATQAYSQYNKLVKEESILRKQQITFENLFADFIKRQELALNIFLEMFSMDINDFYTTMNPNEKVENIKLVPLKDSNNDLVGITIEYDFFEERKSPPIAYLSESHINCLGLSFYLASVKAFNKKNKFFILDDVVSSYDRSHRARFARLLVNKFNDYQILLFTHEREFFELISSEVKLKGWLLQELFWNQENGTSLKVPSIDYRTQIEEKFKNRDINDLGNLIRKYLERQLKTIAFEIEAKVAYRGNEANEKRMSPELLDAIQSKLNKASKELKENADIPKLKGMPMLIGNTASHDNEFQESIEDLQVMWDDIKELIRKFFCKDCNKYLSIKYLDIVEKQIRCSCGKLKYEWKT